MYRVEVLTPPAAGPVTVTVAELKGWLRLNDTSEADTLGVLLGAAVERFEQDTRRPVLATGYRQWVTRWPAWPVVLMRGGVTAVTAVSALAADGTPTALTGWRAAVQTPPDRVVLPTGLGPTAGASDPAGGSGVGWPPPDRPTDLPPAVGCMDFTAGWANAAAVPAMVKVAVRLLAAHWYAVREAYTDGAALSAVPDGWDRVCDRYRLGLAGDWGM